VRAGSAAAGGRLARVPSAQCQLDVQRVSGEQVICGSEQASYANFRCLLLVQYIGFSMYNCMFLSIIWLVLRYGKHTPSEHSLPTPNSLRLISGLFVVLFSFLGLGSSVRVANITIIESIMVMFGLFCTILLLFFPKFRTIWNGGGSKTFYGQQLCSCRR
jgi:hypothetical protein